MLNTRTKKGVDKQEHTNQKMREQVEEEKQKKEPTGKGTKTKAK